MQELLVIGKVAGEYAPWVIVVATLLRSNMKKDEAIAELSANAMKLAQAASVAVRAAEGGEQ